MATSALGLGFDYPHIRWVVHVGPPDVITSFSQESGRAGRDGSYACSIVLLLATWKPLVRPQPPSVDKAAMQLYLRNQHCLRGVLSQFLDQPTDWRWCMDGEETCQVCQEPHQEPRPLGPAWTSAPGQGGSEGELAYTGPQEVLEQDYAQAQALEAYERAFELMAGSCLYCRAESRPFDHRASACPRRFHWIRLKQDALRVRQEEGQPWIAPYVACWKCFQPQGVCRVADPECEEEVECRFPDLVLPLCYGVFCRPGRTRWFQRHFQRTFDSPLDYMLWLGETAELYGTPCIQANRVAAQALAELA